MRTVRLNGENLIILEPGDEGFAEAAAQPKRKVLAGDLELRVSEKRAVSLYGMRRFPVTLYADEWEAIIRHSAAIGEFIRCHPELSRK